MDQSNQKETLQFRKGDDVPQQTDQIDHFQVIILLSGKQNGQGKYHIFFIIFIVGHKKKVYAAKVFCKKKYYEQNISSLIMVGQVLNGIFSSGIMLLTYIVTGQFCRDEARQRAIMIYCSIWGVAEISYFFFYKFIPQWYNHLIFFISIPCIVLAAICFYFILQTPEYCLILAKDFKMYEKIIKKLAIYNKCSNQEVSQALALGRQVINIQSKQNEKQANFKDTMKKLCKDKRSILTCICLAMSQLGFNIFYYGVQGSMERTGYNFGVSMLLIGVHEFLGYLSASYFLPKIKRKKGLVVAIAITSIIGASFLLQAVIQNPILQSIVVSLTRIGCVYAYSFLSILSTQSFSADIKSTAIGLTIALGQIGRILVPYFIIQMNDIGVHPMAVSSILYLGLGIIPLIPVRQTFKEKESQRQQQKLLQNSLATQDGDP